MGVCTIILPKGMKSQQKVIKIQSFFKIKKSQPSPSFRGTRTRSHRGGRTGRVFGANPPCHAFRLVPSSSQQFFRGGDMRWEQGQNMRKILAKYAQICAKICAKICATLKMGSGQLPHKSSPRHFCNKI